VSSNPAALQFDGTDDHVEVPASTAWSTVSAASPLSASFWFYPTRMGGTGPDPTLSTMLLSDNTRADGGFQLPDSWWSEYYQDGALVFMLWTGGGTAYSVYSQVPTLTQWIHVDGAYDGTTQKLFVDGQVVASATPSVSLSVGSRKVMIGSGVCPVDSNNYDCRAGFFEGRIDEIAIWNVARTDAQIAAGTATRLQGSESGLVAYWRLDDGSGTSAADSTGSGHTRTLVNGPSWTNSVSPVQ